MTGSLLYGSDTDRYIDSLYLQARALQKSKPVDAIFCYSKIIEYYNDKDRPDSIALAKLEIGKIYNLQGYYEQSFKYLSEAAAFFEKKKDLHSLGITYNVFGNIHYFNKRYNKAIQYYKKSLVYLSQTPDRDNYAGTYMNLGLIYIDINQPQKSFSYLEEALMAWEQAKNNKGISYAHFNTGKAYDQMKEYRKALYYCTIAIDQKYRSFLDVTTYSYFQAFTAIVFLHNGNANKARQLLQAALKQALQAKATYSELYIYDCYAKLDSTLKDYQSAFQWKSKYVNLYNSISEKDKASSLLNLEQVFDAERKEMMVRNLQKQNDFKEQALQKESKIKNLYILLLGLTLVVLVGVSYFLIFTRKINHQLHEKNQILIQSRNRLQYLYEVLESNKIQLEQVLGRYIDSKKKEKLSEVPEIYTSRLFSNISHEIRTPMNAIVGLNELIMDEKISPEEKEKYMKTVSSSVSQLSKVINNVIELAVLDTSDLQIHISSFSLTELFGQLHEKTFRLIQEQNKEGLVIPEIDPPYLSGEIILTTDKIRLEQILENLLDNAVKFTERGKITLEFEKHNKLVKFILKDTGIGIPPDKLDQVYIPFFKVTSQDRLFPGAGLGLSICKQLIHILNGEIKVFSEPGNGTVFEVILPA